MPPVEIDGNPITGATIDGQDVEEITVDGQTVFTAGPTNNPRIYTSESDGNINEHSTDTRFQIDNLTLQNTTTVNDGGVDDIYVSPDGTLMFHGSGNNGLDKYALLTPYDISSRGGVLQSVSGKWAYARFSDDGTYLLRADNNDGVHYQYELSTPFDISSSSRTLESTMSLGSRSCGIGYADDGNKLYVCVDNSDHIIFDLTTPYEISSRTNRIDRTDSFQSGGAFRGFFINNAGTDYLTTDIDNDFVEHYTINTPYDISDITFVNRTTISARFLTGVYAV